MFENYKSNYNLDLWEAVDRNEVRNYYGESIPEGIDKSLRMLDNAFISEAIEVDGKVYDNLEDVYHVGTVKEFTDPKQFLKAIYPQNLKAAYKNDKDYPIDFWIESIDPQSLKRIGFMIVYERNPFGVGLYGGEKPEGRLIVYKGKAFAAEVFNNKHRLAFMIKNSQDIDKAAEDQALRVSWHWEKKNLTKLKPSQIYSEMLAGINKLKSAKYDFVSSNTDFGEYI